MDWTFIKQSILLFIEASEITLKLGFAAILFSLIIGLVCCICTYYKIPVLKTMSKIYVELSRNTPSLVQLFFMYYGLPKIGLMLQAQTCAIVSLSFLGGGYMAEAFRSGFETVSKMQIETGMSIALNKRQIFSYIILPESLTTALPNLGANAIFLIKETSIVSAVALMDITFVAKDIIGTVYKTNEALFMMVVFYLIILLPCVIMLHILEKKVRKNNLGY